MGSQQFSLKWKNHQRNMLTTFERLLSNEALVDVTLACEGLSLKAHKMVLSASSPFFQNLFLENPCKHPIVIMKDIKFAHLKAIVEFVYRGEVSVPQDQLTTLLKTAETLKVKGLADLSDDEWQAGTDQENENYFFTPIHSSDSQKQEKITASDSNHSDSEELSFPRSQEQNCHSVVPLNETVHNLPHAHAQPTPCYLEFGSAPSQMAFSCSTPQQDGTYKSARHISQGSSPNHASVELTLQSSTQHSNMALVKSSQCTQLAVSSTIGMPKLIKQEPDTYNNQMLLPNLIGLLSEPYPQNQVSQGRAITYPSTSSFVNAEKEGSDDDSYLDVHDSKLLLSQQTNSINNIVGTESLGDCQKSNDNNLPKRTTNSTQSTNKKLSPADRPFACTICNKRFTQKSNLQMHQQTHSGNKPNKCEICGTRFTRSRDLARHHLIHTGEKPFACGTCGKKFNRNSHVRRHERLVHRKTATTTSS